MSNQGADIAFAAVGFFAGLVMFWKGFQDLRRKRLIEAIPTSKVRSMSMGTVELCGTIDASAEDVLPDPIYGKDSVFYRIQVEEYRSSGKSGRWVSVHCEDTTNRNFWLADDTGRVLVCPKGATDYYKVDLEFEQGLFHESNPEASAYIEKVAGSSLLRTRRMKARIVRPGDPFYVLGWALPLDQRPPWSPRATLAQEPGGEQHVASAVIGPTPEGLLVLADESESDLKDELGALSTLFIWGGPLLTIACLAYLCARLGAIEVGRSWGIK